MLIWILALILFAVAGVCGYKLGAVRFGVSLVGLIIAAALALPLGPYLQPLLRMAGVKSPVWMAVLPPIIVFLLVYAVFIGLSLFVHRKVELHYKYNADDTARFRWERVNRAVGLWVGLVMGAVWLILISTVIYGVGYLTVQLTTDETNSTLVRLTSQARQDLKSTGLEQAVAPFDPMPARYYQAADILGLVYQNPLLLSRLAQYPPFLLYGEKPEFQELANDTEFNQMLVSKADAMAIYKHPKMQAVIQNQEIVQDLVGQDLADLRTYLETGASPKYEEEKILGKWRLDAYATMAQERKLNPDMSSTEMRRLKAVMTEIMAPVSVIATTDRKLVLKAEGVADKLQQLYAPAAARPATEGQEQQQPGMSPDLAQRYGMARPQAARPTAAPSASTAKPVRIPFVVLSAQGIWERDGDRYELKVQDEKGQSQTFEASADDDRLTVKTPNVILVFAKAE